MERTDFRAADGTDLRFREGEPRVHPSAELKGCRLGRFVEIGPRVSLRETEVGDYSYFERGGEAAYARIGKFCSIAANVRLNALAHPMDRVTTHKITYRPNEYFRFLGVETRAREARRASAVTIGHDVWIGHGAIVMPGIAVGNGAVIGAGAVVTRDVPPYTVVAGSPARPLRARFATEIAARLLALRWWDWSPERLFDAIPDMQALSVEAFLDTWEERVRDEERDER